MLTTPWRKKQPPRATVPKYGNGRWTGDELLELWFSAKAMLYMADAENLKLRAELLAAQSKISVRDNYR